MTNDEFDKIVFAVTEKVLLRMEEVIGNLMKNHAEVNKLTKNFYKKYPEFKQDPMTVRAVMKEMEEKNAGMKYEEVTKLAAPIIKERMKIVNSLDIKNVKEKTNLDLNVDINGAL